MIGSYFGRRGALRRLAGLGVGAAALGSTEVGGNNALLQKLTRDYAGAAGETGQSENATLSPAAQALHALADAAQNRQRRRSKYRIEDIDADIASLRLPRATKVRMQVARNDAAHDEVKDLYRQARRLMGREVADDE